MEFRQTSEGRGFLLLGYSLFKNGMIMVLGVCEAGNGHGFSVPPSGTDAW